MMHIVDGLERFCREEGVAHLGDLIGTLRF
jgi:hypothetical protein